MLEMSERIMNRAFELGHAGLPAGEAAMKLLTEYVGHLHPNDLDEGSKVHGAYLDGRFEFLEDSGQL